MRKSLDFCKKATQDWNDYELVKDDWSRATELSVKKMFRAWEWQKEWETEVDIDGEEYEIKIEFEINPNADFETFTYGKIISDYMSGCDEACAVCMEDCLDGVFFKHIYDKKSMSPKNGDTIKYTIGNFIVSSSEIKTGYISHLFEEHPDDNERDIAYRYSVLLPIKAEIKKR